MTRSNAFGVTNQRKPTEYEVIADFIRGFPAHTLMQVVADNLSVRTDFDPDKLEQQANQIGRIAHERARHERRV